jgi:acyl-CoA reductase-like NAD-dependent aldehyde dehydrogenase
MPASDTLGAALVMMMRELSDTISRTPDKTRRDQLLAQQDQVRAQLQPLIDKAVEQNMAEYQEATGAVNEAIKALKATQADIQKVAKAIEVLATAISALTKLASAI